MFAKFAATLALTLLTTFGLAQVEEKSVDFLISPSVIQEGKIHVGFEWLKPQEFLKRRLSVIDTVKVNALSPGNNQIIASKLAFVSKRSFDQLNYQSMNNAAFISKMLSSVSIKNKSSDSWLVTNKVRAYGLPINVSFDLKFNEIPAGKVPYSVASYLRDEGAALSGTNRERFLVLDMTNFSQLMYRNFAYVYIKELSAHETIIVAGIVAGFDIDTADILFAFSSTRGTMMNNMREQIMQMARSIQSGK